MQSNKLIFCADDWGFSPGINEGILDLARKGLIYSVSCTANAEYLSHGLKDLIALKDNGLTFNIHFNLTYKSPINCKNESLYSNKTGSFYSFKSFFLKSCSNQLLSLEVRNEFEEQMRVLQEHNIPISCLDGHQHIHILPFIYNSIKYSFKKVGISSVRYMNDLEHPMSFLQGIWFEKMLFKKSEDLQAVPCGYLLSKNLVNLKKIEKKIKKFKRLIIHPAKFDDFLIKNMTDKLKEERIIEFNKIMEYFHDR